MPKKYLFSFRIESGYKDNPSHTPTIPAQEGGNCVTGTVSNMDTCPHKNYFTYRTANIANHMMADAIPFDKG